MPQYLNLPDIFKIGVMAVVAVAAVRWGLKKANIQSELLG